MKTISHIFCFRYCKNCKKRTITIPKVDNTLCCNKCLSKFEVVGFYSQLLEMAALGGAAILFGLDNYFWATVITLLIAFNMLNNDYLRSLLLPLKKL